MIHAVIRFLGEPGKNFYYLKLGPIIDPNQSEREFEGGDEITVTMKTSPRGVNCVDLTFEDGEFALEVSHEYFEVVREINGR
ncbi:MAG: hypothetical protein COA78_34350 [Blastopirellula sp.]|nr:MAG: hypothetical protein COA78_34350 [Blastopirellula sp.]